VETRLLIIEDEAAILTALKMYFEGSGFAVDAASERGAAEALISAHHYAVVIADLRLTDSFGTEGLEIITFVRQHSPGTKVILLTAYGSPELEGEAWRRGVHAFLHKPQPLSAIAAVVSSLMLSP
jgi:DNA-binding NtrC family response regulator